MFSVYLINNQEFTLSTCVCPEQFLTRPHVWQTPQKFYRQHPYWFLWLIHNLRARSCVSIMLDETSAFNIQRDLIKVTWFWLIVNMSIRISFENCWLLLWVIYINMYTYILYCPLMVFVEVCFANWSLLYKMSFELDDWLSMNVSFDEAVNSDNILLYAFGFDVILYIILFL